MFTFRPARASDRDRLIDIHFNSFPDPRGVAARETVFFANPLGTLDDAVVVEKNGAIVGHAFLFAMQCGFGGRAIQAGGIASVGVAPEARGSGVASALLNHLHEVADQRGDVITLLFPFREAFYARLGYASVAPNHRLGFRPAAVPREWRGSGDVQVRAATGADREAIATCYETCIAKNSGWIARTARYWDFLLADERRYWVVATRADALVGYAAWELAQSEPHAATQLHVRECVAIDDDARRALLATMGGQRDQVSLIEMEVASDDPIAWALVDPDAADAGTERVEHPSGLLSNGPMVRITNVRRALDGRRCAEAVTIGTDAQDDRLQIRDEKALASILFGTLRPSEAARLGWCSASTSDILAKADRSFSLPRYFTIDRF